MKDAFFIINPISGKGLKDNIIAELEKQGFRYGITRYAGHAEKLARECAEPIVFAVGGDGTVNEVGRGLLGSDKVLGILPCGSGDGLARCLGISHRITRAISLAENGRQLPLDVGYINGKPFFSVCGVGFDADVSKRFAESGRRGVITYIDEAYKLWRTFKPAQFSISIDGRQWSQEAVLITVGNSNQWGNEAKVTPHADISDGILDITVLDMFHNIELPHLATMLMVGNCDASSRVHCYRGKSIVIERETDGAVHFDGDWFITGRRIEIDIHPAELKVLAP
ncbi:MAG: diacylglycerol kinase family lipid kinase [Bacteroidales bacterium]|nr:diacylglycerol kinase family lipid kinase [Bacteroidales bacterium]